MTLMEKNGLDINYQTDIDFDVNPQAFANTKSIVLGGHSEYWTQKMRSHFDAAVAQGINLLVFGGRSLLIAENPKCESGERQNFGSSPFDKHRVQISLHQ